MITRVNTVLVADKITTTTDDESNWNVGECALFDLNKKFITSEEAAAEASSIYIGVITDSVKVAEPSTGALHNMPVFRWSNEIQKSGHPRLTALKGTDTKEEVVKIKNEHSTDDDAIVGHRYVLRIVYKDINEAPGQFTHTYEVYAKTNKFEDVFKELADKINKHKNRRVQADATKDSNKTLQLTALPKDDNDGVDSLNEYSQVSMEVTFYETIPGALLANQPKPVEDITITKTPGDPGRGNWKIVRDEERKNLGYLGHVFTGAYPEVSPRMLTQEGVKYDIVTIESDNLYVSNDNQYIKTTPVTVTLYLNSAHASDNIGETEGLKYLKAFITGEATASEAA